MSRIADLRTVDFYDRIAEEYDRLLGESDFYTIAREQERRVLLKFIDGRDPGTALDVGSGTGEYALRLAECGYHTVALEPSKGMIGVAARKARNLGLTHRLEFVDGGVCELRLDTEFDVIVAFGSLLNHVERWDRAIAILSERLLPGGLIFLSFENLLGGEEIGLIAGNLRSGKAIGRSFRNLWDCATAQVRGRRLEKLWTVEVHGEILTMRSFYQPSGQVERLLRENGIKTVARVGANFTTCFLPWVRSSIDFQDGFRVGQVRSVMTNIFRKVDDAILSRDVLSRIGAQLVVVGEKEGRPGS